MKSWMRLLLSLTLVMLLSPGLLRVAAQSTPVVNSVAGQLLVADVAARALYVYGLDDQVLLATLNDVSLNSHAGFLALPDGRVLFVDDGTKELVAIRVGGEAGLEVVGRVSVPSAVSHFAVNPAVTHAIVGAADPTAPLTLVDLGSYTSRSFVVDAGEAGVLLGDDPLTIFHRNDALSQVEAYPVAAIERGVSTPTGVVDTGAFGHGEAIDHERGRLYLATDDGFDVVDIVPEGLAYRTTLPWAVSGRDGGRAYFARIAPGGDALISYIADRDDDDTPWADWTNDVYLIDLETEESRRVKLAPGLVYRFGLSDQYGLFFNMHPDGDNALLVDTDAASTTFGEVVATIPLELLTAGPTADDSPWEAESRVVALTPDGTTGFVTHGGDGLISVIDTASRQITGQITVPTSLAGGGYVIAVQPEMPFADTVAR